jgi:hypothetical protein
VDNILKDLSDDPSEYLREGGQVLMTRQGKEHAFTLNDSPGVGIVVQDPEKSEPQQNIPLLRYVQQELLQLPRLASQIVKTIDRASSKRPTQYIEGSAEVTTGTSTQRWDETSSSFRKFLGEQELGTTRLIQLMAGAGQGKTVLLEQLAREPAASYQPDSYPAPFLLTVDLLGRYVGSVDDAIAGSLNNTYMFPSLTQRDVALCVRNRHQQRGGYLLTPKGAGIVAAACHEPDALRRIIPSAGEDLPLYFGTLLPMGHHSWRQLSEPKDHRVGERIWCEIEIERVKI